MTIKGDETAGGDETGGRDEKLSGTIRVITENIECLAIAIVMALMLKFFLIEAYKIPTGSMQPTIIGDKDQGIFDRVLVNKFLYLLGEPERWDVIVFKYPLDQSKNYIKRLIGLPGERVTIKQGDIFINDRIERKPEATLGAVLKRIYPSGEEGESFQSYFRTEGNCKVVEQDEVVFKGPGTVTTAQPIRAKYLDGYNRDYNIQDINPLSRHQLVYDVRLAFKAILDDEDGGLMVRMEAEGMELLFFLKGRGHPGKSHMQLRPMDHPEASSRFRTKHGDGLPGGGEIDDPVWSSDKVFLEAGRTYDLVFTNVDDRITLHIDGGEVIRHDYEGWEPVSEGGTNPVSFGPVECGAAIKEIALYRDIYYTTGRNDGPKEFRVPPGHYFAMGDNTQNSSDSRVWQAAVFTIKDGTVIKGNLDEKPDPRYPGRMITVNPAMVDGGYVMTDIYGDRHELPSRDIKNVHGDYGKPFELEDAHFIPEKLMLGKAMVVFWPIYPHFRWKLLR